MSASSPTLRILRLCLLICALAAGPASASEIEHWVEVGGARYRVELAADGYSRARGLMFRESMPSDAGMLFLFDREYPQSFWMKNTLIALDILYFDRRARLVSVSADTPPCRTAYCPSYPSTGPAQYVLELNAGEAKRLGLEPGAVLHFGPGIPATAIE